jgi:hypothetical protein
MSAVSLISYVFELECCDFFRSHATQKRCHYQRPVSLCVSLSRYVTQNLFKFLLRECFCLRHLCVPFLAINSACNSLFSFAAKSDQFQAKKIINKFNEVKNCLLLFTCCSERFLWDFRHKNLYLLR